MGLENAVIERTSYFFIRRLRRALQGCFRYDEEDHNGAKCMDANPTPKGGGSCPFDFPSTMNVARAVVAGRQRVEAGRADVAALMHDLVVQVWVARRRFDPAAEYSEWARSIMSARLEELAKSPAPQLAEPTCTTIAERGRSIEPPMLSTFSDLSGAASGTADPTCVDRAANRTEGAKVGAALSKKSLRTAVQQQEQS